MPFNTSQKVDRHEFFCSLKFNLGRVPRMDLKGDQCNFTVSLGLNYSWVDLANQEVHHVI